MPMFSAAARKPGPCLVLLLTLWGSATAMAENQLDIAYAERPTGTLMLDLYLPEGVDDAPLVVWLHGGAWQFGDKSDPLAMPLVPHGFALASLDFRSAAQAAFPAQLQDIREALSFLRANAGRYAYRADKVALAGHSSGGHLAALAGLAGEEGVRVQAVIDISGPTNLTTILQQSTPAGLQVREPALELLLGGSLEDPAIFDLAREASPVFHLGPADPPLLLVHGLQDPQVPVNQALELEAAYREAGLPVESLWLPQAGHFSPGFFSGPSLERMVGFLRRHLY